jgi:hypothetical protein
MVGWEGGVKGLIVLLAATDGVDLNGNTILRISALVPRARKVGEVGIGQQMSLNIPHTCI